eukprot:scaffold10082_cov115-Isochrysis_galbana.AAC.11
MVIKYGDWERCECVSSRVQRGASGGGHMWRVAAPSHAACDMPHTRRMRHATFPTLIFYVYYVENQNSERETPSAPAEHVDMLDDETQPKFIRCLHPLRQPGRGAPKQ